MSTNPEHLFIINLLINNYYEYNYVVITNDNNSNIAIKLNNLHYYYN